MKNQYIDNELLDLIISGKVDKTLFTEILKSRKINDLFQIKNQLMDAVLNYVEEILNDHKITDEEIQNATRLKRLFEIKEGDFYQKKHSEVKQVLDKEFSYILSDGRISDSEEIQKVGLQDLFDLGYDQYLEFYQDFKNNN